ncbi:uncharacterized protein LOC111081425 [Drosophila obscura]|uniref:uncharacterized protein LOC111081425 n=1 Tax=Drosophila obscura TaxID=7282 RepID=UPI001BB21F98|nr:uncharacterized protein LOC111081425 [Drosophila obscura]
MFVTRSARFNFLGEYWNACAGDDVQARELVCEAATVWQALSPAEKLLFEEDKYLRARFAEAGSSADRERAGNGRQIQEQATTDYSQAEVQGSKKCPLMIRLIYSLSVVNLKFFSSEIKA